MGDVIRLKDRKVLYNSSEEIDQDVTDMSNLLEELEIQEMIDNIVDHATEHMREWLHDSGLSSDTQEFYRDLHHLRESMHALIARAMNKEHPWHETTDKLIKQEIEADGTVSTYWQLDEEED